MQKMNYPSLLEAFEPGDFLFGLENEAREFFYDDLRSKLTILGAKYLFVTIDDIVKPLEQDYIYGNNHSLSPLEKQSTPVKTHGRLLLSSSAFTEITQNFSSPSTQERNKLIFSCLTAIKHHTGRIHFCLDGINLDKARNKHPSCRKEYASFTSVELRYVAKHYQNVGNKVLFYMQGERVEAPWDALGQTALAWLETYAHAAERVEDRIQPQRKAVRQLVFFDDRGVNNREENSEARSPAKRLKLEANAVDFNSAFPPPSP